MEWWVAAGRDVNKLPMYDCGRFNLTREQWYSLGQKQPIIGWGALVYGLFIEAIYIPCLIVVSKQEYLKMSCYKIMLFIGLNDMFAIIVNSVVTGYVFITGAVYCADPDLIFISGGWGLAGWCSACLACLFLVFNRICTLWRPGMADVIFGGKRTYVLLSIPFFYCLYFGLFTPPLLFSSPRQGWFFYPFFEDAKKFFTDAQWDKFKVDSDFTKYMNYAMGLNNLFVVIASCCLYVVFCLVLLCKFYMKSSEKMSWSQKSIFLQSALISLANLYTSLVYVYMQLFPVPPYLVCIGHMGCMFSHGFPAIIYLTVNKSIRSEVLAMFGYKPSRINQFTIKEDIVNVDHQSASSVRPDVPFHYKSSTDTAQSGADSQARLES